MRGNVVDGEEREVMKTLGPYNRNKDTAFYLGIYLEKTKILILKRYMHPNVHSSTVYNSQGIEAT